jgi:hypothetical protein
MPELTVFSVIVMDEKLGLLITTSSSNLTVLRMIGRNPLDEGDVFSGNGWPSNFTLRFAPPELSKLPSPPTNYCLRLDDNQCSPPVLPDPSDMRPE